MSTITPAHRRLVRHLFAHEDVTYLEVDLDYDDGSLEHCKTAKAAIDALEQMDGSRLILRHGGQVQWALVVPFGCSGEETVADYTLGGLMEEACEAVYASYE